MLLCIAIIGVLLSIGVPIGMAARSAAKRIGCANNMRQVGQAITADRASNLRVPEARPLPEPFVPATADPRPLLNTVLKAYLPPWSNAYCCPADERVWRESAAVLPTGLGNSYTYHSAVQSFYLTDTAGVGRYADGTSWKIDPPHPGGRINYLQSDGSVSSDVPRP